MGQVDGEVVEAVMFRSTGQALHFAFRMQLMDAPIKCPLGDEMRRELGEAAFNADQLNPMELRALCAQIRKRVDGLGGLRWATLQARYAFMPHKRDALRVLVRDAAPIVGFENVVALGGLVWSMYLPTTQRAGLSYRKLEAETGVSKSALHRAGLALRDRWEPYERLAYDLLTESLVRDQLVVGA